MTKKSGDEKQYRGWNHELLSILSQRGHWLPTSATDVTDEDLSLYGKGKAISIEELRSKVDQVKERSLGNNQVDSWATAARNGRKIDEQIWERMHRDRTAAEDEQSSE